MVLFIAVTVLYPMSVSISICTNKYIGDKRRLEDDDNKPDDWERWAKDLGERK